MTDKRKVSYKPVSHTINTTILEDNYNETKIANNLIGVSFKTKNEIKKQINGIFEVLKKYKNKKLTDEIKKELDDKLKEFNNYIRNISLNTSNFSKIQDLINVFRADYYNVVGIKRDEKEDITAENGIGLFELFEAEKKVEKTNEQSIKSSSGTGTETGSSTSSDNCKMKETKETKSEDDTTLTTSDSSENEIKEKQSGPAETAVHIEDNKESEKSKSGSCSSARSDSSASTEDSENEMKKVESSIESKQILEWKEIANTAKTYQYINPLNKDIVNTKITHTEAQEQVYQIAQVYAQKIKDGTFKIEENNSKTFVISDTHGDMGAILEALLRSGVVEFVDTNNPCKVIVDPNNLDNRILIPNLKLKDGCNNKLIILGDIIDRGFHSDSCMMLMKDILRQQKESGKSKNIILTVGNHEDMTIIGANDYLCTLDNTDYKEGNNKDYNTAQDVLMSMVEEDEMVFCYYDENSNTIYSHVPFDVDNTYNALNFVCSKIQTEDSFLECNNDEIVKLATKINNQEEGLDKTETKLLVDILNKLYKDACKNKDVMTELQQNVYCKNGQNDGLLWNRNYTENSFKAIKGLNFVGGHDPKKNQKHQPTHEIQQSNTKTVIDIDTDRSYGYTNETKTALVEIKHTENSKIEAIKLDDVNTIKYNENKTIETINSVKPSGLEDNDKFDVEDINKYTNKSRKLEQIVNDLTSNKYTSCIEYLKQHNYSKSALQDIVLNDEFKKKCLFVEQDNSQQAINNVWIKLFITKIYQEFKTDHTDLDEMYSLYDEIFDLLNDKSLKLTKTQKEVINTKKQEIINEVITSDDVFNTNGIEDYYDNKIKHILNNCCAYIERNDYNTEAIKTIISRGEFENNIRSSFGKKMVDISILRDNFIEPLIKKYNETHTNAVEQYGFVNTLFDIIDEELKLTKNKNVSQTFKKLKAEKLQEPEQHLLISINDIRTNSDNKKTVKLIDNNLTGKGEKQQLVQNTIDLIKSQKSQLQHDNVKLQKAATLMLLLEVYKISVDNFNSVNEVYKMLNDTVKKQVKKIDSKQQYADLSSFITEINGVLSKKDKEQIKDVNISF